MSRLFVAPIDEVEREMILTPSDYAVVEGVTSSKRAREIKAWRTLLRSSLREMGYVEESMREIRYSEVGAPYIANSHLHISVSHSASAVAIAIAERACGVDIERLDRNFERVAGRYATDREVALFDECAGSVALAVIWSAKEALYKVAGVGEVDFIRDVEILSVEGDVMQARILDRHHKLLYIFKYECVVVSTLDR